MKIEVRPPRSSEYFRVRPGEKNCKQASVLDDVPEKGIITNINFAPPNYGLTSAGAPKCESETAERFLWTVDENDGGSHAMARAAETEWIARPAG